jgi:hypothetical protein
MEECLINLNKSEDDEGRLQFCNINKWSAGESAQVFQPPKMFIPTYIVSDLQLFSLHRCTPFINIAEL